MKRFIANIIRVKLGYILFSFLGLMLLFASCHNEPIVLNPLTTLNIELQKNAVTDGIASKIEISEFDAVVSVAYSDDTVSYKCHFIAADNTSELYIYDFKHSDIVYATINTPFNVLVDVVDDGNNLHGESEIYIIEDSPIAITVNLDISSPAPQEQYIDLGLPSGILWATCNLGATSPEGYGNYYAWGENYAKESYIWDNYVHYPEDTIIIDTLIYTYRTIIKYCESDGLTNLESSDDAATVNLGANWRIPSSDEFEELLINSTTTWTTRNGVNGYEFVGPNGNSIFLPAAGGRSEESSINKGACGFYWLNSVTYDEYYAYGFILDSTSLNETSYYRMYGQTIRPVYDGR